MKKLSSTIIKCLILSTFGITCISQSTVTIAQEYEIISFSEKFSNYSTTYKPVSILPKEYRLNKQSSQIKITQDELPDSINKCILFAKDIWESSINSSIPIIVDIKYEFIENDIETDVIYLSSSTEAIPNSLYKYLEQGANDLTDGTIIINSNTNWDCSVGNESESNFPNLTFAVLRSFAKILGFGSNIRIDNNKMLYWNSRRFYTIFDRNIKSSDNKLICDFDLNRGRPSQPLTDFFNTPNRQFYFSGNNTSYELEKTPADDQSVLSYFKNETNSLMSFSPKKGSYFFKSRHSNQICFNEIRLECQISAEN